MFINARLVYLGTAVAFAGLAAVRSLRMATSHTWIADTGISQGLLSGRVQ